MIEAIFIPLWALSMFGFWFYFFENQQLRNEIKKRSKWEDDALSLLDDTHKRNIALAEQLKALILRDLPPQMSGKQARSLEHSRAKIQKETE